MSTPRPEREEKQRATDEITELAPGVLRSQLPIDLPGLGHVNMYILEDERGIAVVDPGLPGEDSFAALENRLKAAGFTVNDIHTVIATHSHSDHYGGAERLRSMTDLEVLTHESFQPWSDDDVDEFRDIDADENDDEADDDEAPWGTGEELTPWGTKKGLPPKEFLDRWKGADRRWFRTPRPDLRVTDGQVVTLARREWVAVHTPGHTVDHLCLFDPVEGIMISGDHVLPTITPHIGGMNDATDPLADFFDSLRRMTDFDAQLVLPAHGHPFNDLSGRAMDILEHHEDRLDTIREAASTGEVATVGDYMKVLFRERSWGYMAESETYAHLVHLEELGELDSGDRDGLVTFAPLQP